jgi:hypothetical protein
MYTDISLTIQIPLGMPCVSQSIHRNEIRPTSPTSATLTQGEPNICPCAERSIEFAGPYPKRDGHAIDEEVQTRERNGDGGGENRI